MKEKIPLIGFLIRWLKNLARLNNLKFRVDILQNQNDELKKEVTQMQQQIDSLKAHLQTMEQNLPNVVAKEIFYESLSLQQRVDQFIFDANIELKTKIAKENE